jgi:uncharacterized coiled-coil protein SlyX
MKIVWAIAICITALMLTAVAVDATSSQTNKISNVSPTLTSLAKRISKLERQVKSLDTRLITAQQVALQAYMGIQGLEDAVSNLDARVSKLEITVFHQGNP